MDEDDGAVIRQFAAVIVSLDVLRALDFDLLYQLCQPKLLTVSGPLVVNYIMGAVNWRTLTIALGFVVIVQWGMFLFSTQTSSSVVGRELGRGFHDPGQDNAGHILERIPERVDHSTPPQESGDISDGRQSHKTTVPTKAAENEPNITKTCFQPAQLEDIISSGCRWGTQPISAMFSSRLGCQRLESEYPFVPCGNVTIDTIDEPPSKWLDLHFDPMLSADFNLKYQMNLDRIPSVDVAERYDQDRLQSALALLPTKYVLTYLFFQSVCCYSFDA